MLTLTKPQAASAPPSPGGQELDGRILRNTGWVALSMGAKQVAGLAGTLVLVHLLEPEAFGLVALAWSVLYFVQQIQETGLGSALIYQRREDRTEAAASVFVYTAVVSVLLFGAGVAAAPLIASIMHAPELTDVLRAMALVLVFRGLGVVPAALLERELNFRSRTVAEVVSTVVQFSLFLGLAFSGLGVWSLVVGNVAAAAAQTLAYWLLTPWRPSPRRASRRALFELMRYGRFVGATNILTVVSNTIDTFTVGRLLGATAVGFYSVSFRLANFPTAVIAFLLGRTMFAAYSLLQDDRAGFRQAYLRNLERITLFAVPVSVGLAVGAKPIVLALLGEKWLAAVLPLRILGVYGLIKSFGGATAEALKGMGKPHVPLVFGGLYAAIVIPALFVLTPLLGLEGAALSMLVATGLTVVPEVGVAMRALDIRVRDLARTLAAPALCATLLAAALALLLPVADSLSPGVALALLASAGFAVYAAATAIFARKTVVALWTGFRAARPVPATTAVPFSSSRDEAYPQRP